MFVYVPLATHLAENGIDAILFDQRQHGKNKTDIPMFTTFDNFESDIIQLHKYQILRLSFETPIFANFG